jgi:hypothetical protein
MCEARTVVHVALRNSNSVLSRLDARDLFSALGCLPFCLPLSLLAKHFSYVFDDHKTDLGVAKTQAERRRCSLFRLGVGRQQTYKRESDRKLNAMPKRQ